MKDISKNHLVIHGWMITNLDLKGTDLIIYALIYGFCQDEKSKFTGSLSYIEIWAGTSKNTVRTSLKSLVNKGLINQYIVEKNGVTFNEYMIVQNLRGGIKNWRGGVSKIDTNIIIDNIDNNNKKNESQNLKSWEDIKAQNGYGMSMNDLCNETIKDEDYLQMISRYIYQKNNKVILNKKQVQAYVIAAHGYIKNTGVIHERRQDYRKHIERLISKDFEKDKTLYEESKLILKLKNSEK
jgi:predicted DNA-binding transcriptional regulator